MGIQRLNWLRPSMTTVAIAGAASAGLAALSYFAATTTRLPGEVAASEWVQSWSGPALDNAMEAVSFVGEVEVAGALLVVAAIALYLVRLRAEAVTLVLATGGGRAVVLAVKELVQRPRPSAGVVRVLEAADGWSFPSGHVTHFAVFFGTLAVFAAIRGESRSRISSLAVGMVAVMAAIGFSRMYLGVHWLGDVIGGYAFGGVFVSAAAYLLSRWKGRSG